MRFDQSFLDEIRARLPVSEVVSRRVKIQRQGREFVGLSPFKAEKTPSFTVNDQKGFYHCFASGEHGDIFKFLMTTEGLSFPEAVERLAHEAGLEMPKPSPEAERRENERKGLIELMEDACRFFELQLASPAGKEARSYLDHRRVGDAQRGKFRLGFAPSGRSALKEHLAAKGYSQEDMVASGMLISGDDIPVSYDRFRNRIIFPISDAKGRVIAFGGRALDADQPAKYLNSPETPLFHKGWVLYNAATARQAAYDTGAVIAVEGYMDVIALAGAGFANVVAPLGTALTEHQLKLLWRMAAEPILSFDGDAAGQKAAYRALETALPHLRPGYSLRFAFLPEGRDPDDLIQMEGADAIKSVFDNARPLADVLWSKEWESGQWNTPERRAALEHRLKNLVSQIQDPIVRSYYHREVRRKIKKHFDSWIKSTKPKLHLDNNKGEILTGAALGIKRLDLLIFAIILKYPDLLNEVSEQFADMKFKNVALSDLQGAILKTHFLMNNLDSGSLHNQLKHYGLGNFAEIIKSSTAHLDFVESHGDATYDRALTSWNRAVREQRESEVIEDIKSAEQIFLESNDENDCALILLLNQEIRKMQEPSNKHPYENTIENNKNVLQNWGNKMKHLTSG